MKILPYYRIGARYYDSDIGGWISPDPMRQFASPYLYVGNGANPLNGVDADGLTLGKNAEALDKQLKEYDYFGSTLLKSDFSDLTKSETLFEFETKPDLTYSYNENGQIFLPEKISFVWMAVLFRHEAWGHILKQDVGEASWQKKFLPIC